MKPALAASVISEGLNVLVCGKQQMEEVLGELAGWNGAAHSTSLTLLNPLYTPSL